MIDLVLATEMARHFEHVSKFINNVSKPLLQKSRVSLFSFNTELQNANQIKNM